MYKYIYSRSPAQYSTVNFAATAVPMNFHELNGANHVVRNEQLKHIGNNGTGEQRQTHT